MNYILSKKILISLLLLCISVYGAVRLYYYMTDGFEIVNITSTFAYDPRWETSISSEKEERILKTALDQPYTYMGKGCQVYAFVSADQKYVLKFFKCQRFRPTPWVELFSFIPAVAEHRKEKMAHKDDLRACVFTSCKLAYEKLSRETGVLYLHLNKTRYLNKEIILYDKLGNAHSVALDDKEFFVQRKGTPLCSYIVDLMLENRSAEVKTLINEILAMVLSEYAQGLEDDDHALMQNTGVCEGLPMHMDVGRFSVNPAMRNKESSHQELFSKMYRFRIWLQEYYPELANFLEERLQQIMGESFFTRTPYFKPHRT
jgi:hypothetical protein